MNTIIINSANKGAYGALYHQHLKQRRKLFVDELGWPVPHDEQIEMDQYDRFDATYVLVEDQGEVVAYARLLPTTSEVVFGEVQFSYLVRDAVEGLLPGIPTNIMAGQPAPITSDVWEMTRFQAKDRRAMRELFRRAAQFLEEVGATHTISFTRRSFMGILNGLHLPTKSVGPDVTYGTKRYCVLVTDLQVAQAAAA